MKKKHTITPKTRPTARRAESSAANVSALLTTLALGAATLPSAQADGAAIRNLADIGQNRQLALNPLYDLAVTTEVRVQSGALRYAGGVAVAPTLIVTAGHFTPGPTSTSIAQAVIFGSDYSNPNGPGYLRIEVERWEQVSSYVPGNPNTMDLGFYWLKQAIPGFNNRVTFGSLPPGGVATLVDPAGNIGDPTTGEMPNTIKMAGYAPRVIRDNNAYPESLYDFWSFNQGASQDVTQNVMGLQNSSGSPWYSPIYTNEFGVQAVDLLGISIFATSTTLAGITGTLDFSTPQAQAELIPRIETSWRQSMVVPEPTSLALLAVPGAIALGRRRKA